MHIRLKTTRKHFNNYSIERKVITERMLLVNGNIIDCMKTYSDISFLLKYESTGNESYIILTLH